MNEDFPQSLTPLCIVAADGTLFWWNTAFQSLFPEQDLLSSTIQDLLFAPELVALCKEGPCQKELRIPVAQEYEPYVLFINPLEAAADGKTLSLLLFQKASWVKQQSRIQNLTITAAAHDLANPVSAIFGYADLLLENAVEDPLSNQQTDITYRIRSTASRAIELVKNYQVLSQLDHHTLSIPISTSELNKVVMDVIDYIWREGPGVAILGTDLSELPVYVAAARFAVERIVANLLSNAAKYTPPNGKISITTKEEDGRAVFSVTNSPAFIPKSEQIHIFEKFRRGGSSKDKAGSGLGLYIVKSLADSVKAELKMFSNEEEGTTFSVYFPISNAP